MTDKDKIAFVLGDLIEVFKVIQMEPDTQTTVNTLNSGWCGMVATIAGYILKEKYGVKDLTVCSHPIHIFLGHEGRYYDTIFPFGYQSDILELWGLKEHQLKASICSCPVGEEPNKGWWDWEFIALASAMYKRHKVNPPSHFANWIKETEDRTTTPSSLKQKAAMDERLKVVKFLPATQFKNIKDHPLFFDHLRQQEYLYDYARIIS